MGDLSLSIEDDIESGGIKTQVPDNLPVPQREKGMIKNATQLFFREIIMFAFPTYGMTDEQKRAYEAEIKDFEENQERWNELMENIKAEQEAEQQAAVASYLDEEAEKKQKGFIDQIEETVASTIGAGQEPASQLEERDTGGVSSSSRPPPRRKK